MRGKKIIAITTITVLVTTLILTAIVNDAEAVPNTKQFKCNNVVGSFFPPPLTAGLLFSSGVGQCSTMGSASLASITTFVGAPGPSGANCILLATPAGLDSYAISKNSHVTFSMALEQCFFDALGAPASPAGPFCTAAGTDNSVVTGAFTVTGGLVNGKVVTGGAGTITSTVDHCDPSAPFGNSFVSKLTGTFTV